MKKVIDYDALIENIDEMINTLEYDSMRSAGKCKINSETLLNMYALKERYTKRPVKKTPVKEG